MGDLKSRNHLPNYCYLTILSLLIISMISIKSLAQVVSPELRRLSVATNQFGIDALRALDRIEPPDKVLVFCPVCLSSSLTMIMMGSSKYQVVSSLRHALYVWALKPQEINRGFRDIFDHIGFNQIVAPTQRPTGAIQVAKSRDFNAYGLNHSSDSQQLGLINDETRLHPVALTHPMGAKMRSLDLARMSLNGLDNISLPALIRLKSMLEKSVEPEKAWWHSISRRSQDKQTQGEQTMESGINSTSKGQRLARNESIDANQMNALSNIYIQRGLNMNYNYNLLLRQHFKTVIHPVDFLRNSEETRLHINSLVASSTEGKIKDLVKKSTLELRPVSRIMMISTFHFRGTLDIKMKARDKLKQSSIRKSRQGRRRRSDGRNNRSISDVNVKKPPELKVSQFIETDSTPLKYGHFSNLGCSVIEIPFDNRLVTLVIVMPDDRNSTDLLLTRLSAQILSDLINSLVVKRLSLGIPVIKFDRGPINMSGLLQELGLDNIFYGDRSYSTETGLNRWMRPSDIVHETSIDIGTMSPDWGQPEDRLKLGAHDGRNLSVNHIKLDKPFFYFVMDSINSMILTMGRIRQ